MHHEVTGLKNPEVGNRLRSIEKKRINIKPSQNVGIESPKN